MKNYNPQLANVFGPDASSERVRAIRFVRRRLTPQAKRSIIEEYNASGEIRGVARLFRVPASTVQSLVNRYIRDGFRLIVHTSNSGAKPK